MNERRSRAGIRPGYAFLIILVLGFVVYGNSFRNEFVWDDEFLIVDNTAVREPSAGNALSLFGQNLGRHGGGDMNYYRPLQELSYMLDHALWGPEPAGFHLTNLLLHATTGFLLFLIADRILGRREAALAGAMIYVAHPLHTEAVTYIAGRADPLAGMCMLTALYLYVTHRTMETTAERCTYLGLACGSFVCALLARESALVLPVLLIFYDVTFTRDEGWKTVALRLLPFCSVAAVYVAARITVLDFGYPISSLPEGIGFYERTLMAFKTFAVYAGLIFAPFNLHMDRVPVCPRSILEPPVLAAAGLAAAVVIVTLLMRRRRPAVHFCLGWFLITLFPSSNIPVALSAALAEHWLYVPLMGITVIGGLYVVKAAHALTAGKAARAALTWIASGIIVLYLSVLTVRQNGFWRDGETLYTYTLQHTETARLHTNLGRVYLNGKRPQRALEEFERAREMDPSNHSVHFNMGLAHAALHDWDRAMACFDRALEHDEGHHRAHCARGDVYMQTGAPAKAEECYLTALRIEPGFVTARFKLGNAYLALEKYAQAEQTFRALTALEPPSEHAWNLLAEALVGQGKIDEAREAWKRSLSLDPGQTNVRNLIRTHEADGRP